MQRVFIHEFSLILFLYLANPIHPSIIKILIQTIEESSKYSEIFEVDYSSVLKYLSTHVIKEKDVS